MTATAVLVTNRYLATVTRGVVEGLLFQARSYGAPAGKHLLTPHGADALMLSSICRQLSDESEDIFWTAIVDGSGMVVAHTEVRLAAARGQLEHWSGKPDDDLLRTGEAYTVAGDTVRIRIPIRENDLLIGHLELAASGRLINSAQRQSLLAGILITIVILLVSIPLTMLMVHYKLRPISIIAAGLRDARVENLGEAIPLIESRDELGYLAETLRVMGARLEQGQREAVERERMARDLEIAREIQESMLPKSFPSAVEYRFAGLYRSAREVGGDYFDFVPFDGERFGFLVADVSGKSLPAMLVMLVTRDIVRRAARLTSDPAELLCRVNRELLPAIKKEMFVTMFFGVIDSATGQVEFSSAGHNPLLHLAAGSTEVQKLQPRGFPLGMFPPALFDGRIECRSMVLQPGDLIVQFSDGINEARNVHDEEFGMERFVSILGENSGANPETVVEIVERNLSEFAGGAPQFDDITLVAMKWHGRATVTPSGGNRGNREFTGQHA